MMCKQGGQWSPCASLRGFTLIELVMVMLLLGMLAIVALPRFNDAGFREYGYAEETLSALRYARQTAIAGNAHITVQFSADAFRVCRGDTCPGNGYLNNPAVGQPWDGSAKNRGRAPEGVSIVTTLAAVTFDGLGRPHTSGSLTIGSHTLTIEPETGYVH
ncbi:MAG: GspH/FimT family pseudopilin [Gammaproteobacteria bacterium]|nr:GspH/FimT family pseudopilin [Gammaproteobacteria bacterium]